ncbi:hypothetical protein LPJ73_002974 [Coemansia sp. RSA 2703]|nr:hypothetical protein LPJ73_002974 [Coemansia sp. RSA 2703]
MSHPVISISFSKCRGSTPIKFVTNVCETLATVAQEWLTQYESTDSDVAQPNRIAVENLRAVIAKFDAVRYEENSSFVGRELLVNGLFRSLSNFVYSWFGHYILLVDDYDVPFVTITLANWDIETKNTAHEMVKELYDIMIKHMHKGLLVGVFEFPMMDISSGVNNIEPIHTIPSEKDLILPSICSELQLGSLRGLDALADLFWFNANEIELILDQSVTEYPSIRNYRDCIMDTIKDWYNGYRIGCYSGKYNPWSVMSFISRLYARLEKHCELQSAEAMCEIAQLAAGAFWAETGSTEIVEAYVDNNRLEFAEMARRLIVEYEYFRTDCQSNSEEPPNGLYLPEMFLDLPSDWNDGFFEASLLTYCLYAGYLTRREGANVCIPNHEVYQVWTRLFARAVMGNQMSTSSILRQRGTMLQDFYCGKTDLLTKLVLQTHGVLSNHGKYMEKDYTNLVANTLMVASRFGLLTHPSQKSIDPSHAVVNSKAQAGNGRCDYAMSLFGTDKMPNHFGVIIEFKLIPENKAKDSEHCQQLAANALDQITDKRYPMFLSGCLERMDIGMAVGYGSIYTKCRMYIRSTDAEPWVEVDDLISRRLVEQSN